MKNRRWRGFGLWTIVDTPEIERQKVHNSSRHPEGLKAQSRQVFEVRILVVEIQMEAPEDVGWADPWTLGLVPLPSRRRPFCCAAEDSPVR